MEYAQEMAKRMYGLTTNDMKRLAYAVAAKLGVDNKFDNERCLAGKDWLSSFMKRHPTLSIRAPIWAESMDLIELPLRCFSLFTKVSVLPVHTAPHTYGTATKPGSRLWKNLVRCWVPLECDRYERYQVVSAEKTSQHYAA